MQFTLNPTKNVAQRALNAVMAELDELAMMRPNWDGWGALPIEPGIIAGARDFIQAIPKSLRYRPRVVPMPSGNLQLVWHCGPKTLELEFESPKTIRSLKWYPEAAVDEKATFPVADVDRAVELMRWFMSGTCG